MDLTDPRDVPGDIAGPGGPNDRHSVIIDASRAVLLDSTVAVLAHVTRSGVDEEALALLLGGKINHSDDRARVLYVFDVDGAASIVTELEALVRRAGPEWRQAYGQAKTARQRRLAEGQDGGR